LLNSLPAYELKLLAAVTGWRYLRKGGVKTSLRFRCFEFAYQLNSSLAAFPGCSY
jgi:hypothetical protein